MIKEEVIMRIGFTGAQGTGKTTLLNELKKENKYLIITNVARDLVKDLKIQLNENGEDFSQLAIYHKNIEILLSTPSFVSDRSLSDIWAYSKWAFEKKKITSELFSFIEKGIDRYMDLYDIIFYLPIEFSLEKDGVRSTSEEYRRQIDSNIKEALHKFYRKKIYTVEGSIEKRVDKIFKILKGE
jgi:nicotinamide riboside kinase